MVKHFGINSFLYSSMLCSCGLDLKSIDPKSFFNRTFQYDLLPFFN